MLFSRYLGSFAIYNIIILFLFSLSVNSIQSFSIINSISYVFLHYVLIYLGLYYYRKTLYLIYFFCGLGIDILLINQIGPHLSVFMILLIIFDKTKKYFQNLNSTQIYLSILFILAIIIFSEMIITHWFFNYSFEIYIYFKILIISLLLSYPILLLFSVIDKLD